METHIHKNVCVTKRDCCVQTEPPILRLGHDQVDLTASGRRPNSRVGVLALCDVRTAKTVCVGGRGGGTASHSGYLFSYSIKVRKKKYF